MGSTNILMRKFYVIQTTSTYVTLSFCGYFG